MGLYNKLVFAGIAVVLVLSYNPIKNMISPQQRMNESYDGLHLVNSYGLFGSITKNRFEVIISGTQEDRLTASTLWQEYEFKCKPGDIFRRPCWVTPYHLRLDWQMWFSAMRPELQEEWLANLARKMLTNDPVVNRLLARNPFSNQEPPRFVKMDLYLYEFTKTNLQKGQWWERSFVKTYLPPISINNFRN